MRTPATLLASALGLLLGGLTGCDRSAAPPAPRPDVLVVSLDTLRADLLDARRPDGTPEMPRLAAFAAGAVRFPNAFAPMAFTLPSHMTLLTGAHPETHFVTTEKDVLSPEIETLAEVFRQAGYATAGLQTSSWLKAGFGFDRGFELYEEIPMGLAAAGRIIDRVEAELARAQSEGRPAFLFAHIFDAHSDFGFDGNRLSYHSEPAYRSDLEIPDSALCDAEQRCATDYLLWADREQRAVSERDRELHFELYRRGARQLDDALGELFDHLEASGFLPRGAVVVVSDHGEEFREHGRFLHNQVYAESLRVPLLIRPPGNATGGRVDPRPVGLEDLAPTLARLAGLPPPAAHQGFDLLAPAVAGAHAVLVGQDKLRRTRYGLRADQRLLVWDFADSATQLYDLAADPGERVDLAAERPQEVAELRARLIAELRRLRRERPTLRQAEGELFGPRERETLRSLGYL